MVRYPFPLFIALAGLLVLFGCSENVNPLTPETDLNPESSGTPSSLGGLDLDEITGPPIKFDGSDYEHSVSGNLLCVIHGDDTDGYFLSIYIENEIPW